MIKEQVMQEQFIKSVANLREVLEKIKTTQNDRAVYRDSAIQRFEIAFDLAWKTLREKLRTTYGIDAPSPKKCFQEAFKQGIIDDGTIWIDMTDMRNETTHAYNENFAESALAKLPDICLTFEKLAWKLQK